VTDTESASERTRAAAEIPVTCLLLSGGSHRASLGALGVISYLARTGRMEVVTDIVSVSGASMLNASLIADPPTSADDLRRVLGGYARRLLADGVRLRATRRRALVGGMAIAGIGLVLAALVASIVLGWSRGGIWAAIAAAVGVGAVPASIMVVRQAVSWIMRDYVLAVTAAGGTQLSLGDPLPARPGWGVRRHTILAAGMNSGRSYAFQHGGRPLRSGTLAGGYTAADAACASASLPGLGSVRVPGEAKGNRAGEYLIDGGAIGGFGEQHLALDPTESQNVEPNAGALTTANVLYVDALRHVQPAPLWNQALSRVSFIKVLHDWLSVTVEATYVNDLVDAGPERLIRLCDHRFISRGNVDQLRTYSPVQTSWTSASDAERYVDHLRDATKTIDLLKLDADKMRIAISCGVLATAEHFGELGTIEEAKSLATSVIKELGLSPDALRATALQPSETGDSGWPATSILAAVGPRLDPIPVRASLVRPIGQPDGPAGDITIVWAAPQPRNSRRIDVDTEFSALATAIDGFGQHEGPRLKRQIAVVSVPTPTLDEVARVAADADSSTIVHLATTTRPASSDGPMAVVFEAADGTATPATAEDLRRALGERTSCVVLSSDSSIEMVGELGRHVNAIGMASGHTDSTAAAFAAAFYRRLATGDSYERSVAWASTQTSPMDPETKSESVLAPTTVVARLRGGRSTLRERLAQQGTWLVFGERRGINVLQPPRIGLADFTVLAWIRRPALSNSYGYFADTRGSNRPEPASRGWVFGGYSGRLLFQINGGDVMAPDEAKNHRNYYLPMDSSSRPIFDGAWHLVAASVARGGDIVLSIDGHCEWRVPVLFSGVDVSGSRLLTGTALDHLDNAKHHFNGDLAELAVINRVVSLAELAELSVQGLPDAAQEAPSNRPGIEMSG
jgi:Concanavalin A-like lectin/glucanases superfamily